MHKLRLPTLSRLLSMFALLAVASVALAACSQGNPPTPNPVTEGTPTTGTTNQSTPAPSLPPAQPSTGTNSGNQPTLPPAVDTPTSAVVVRGVASVDSVDVAAQPSQPVQVTAKGNLPDACTKIGDVTQKLTGTTFDITIGTTRAPNLMCAQVLTPFTHTVTLDTKGLSAGTYTVNVNGVSKTFDYSGK